MKNNNVVNSQLSSEQNENIGISKLGSLLLELNDDELNLIQRAADILNLEIEEFILMVALEEAQRVIKKAESYNADPAK